MLLSSGKMNTLPEAAEAAEAVEEPRMLPELEPVVPAEAAEAAEALAQQIIVMMVKIPIMFRERAAPVVHQVARPVQQVREQYQEAHTKKVVPEVTAVVRATMVMMVRLKKVGL